MRFWRSAFSTSRTVSTCSAARTASARAASAAACASDCARDFSATAEKLRADAAQARYDVDAAGQRKLNEAANTLSAEQIAMQVRMAILRHLPDIIRESVKPMEQIDGIRIVHVDGLNPGGGTTAGNPEPGATAPGQGNLAEQVVASALRYRAQAPLIDGLMRELGLSGGDLAGLTNAAADASPTDEQERRRRKLDELTRGKDTN